jgi:heat shock protein HtpX
VAAWHRHAAANRLQTLLLVAILLGISGLAGGLLLGTTGLWIALVASLAALLVEPLAVSRLTLALYRARPIARNEAPELWRTIRILAERASLPAIPVPHYVPSAMVNAFAVGNRRASAIALSDGLLFSLTPRELAGVLAHETAHIAHNDLRVMGLADYVSRLTGLFALAGQFSILLTLPWWLAGAIDIHWPAMLLLVFSPHLALLAQLGLSRVREFDADLTAARLTGDPEGLARALGKIERVSRAWRAWLLPGWGNPEPSWLRTHPATDERIRRLLALSRPEAEAPWQAGPLSDPKAPPVRRSPRWHPGGIWH